MNGILEQPAMGRSSALNAVLLDYLQAIDPHAWPGSDGLTLDVVLESYSRAAAAGQVPGKEALLRRHPELKSELEVLFAQPGPRPDRSADPGVSPLYFEHTD